MILKSFLFKIKILIIICLLISCDEKSNQYKPTSKKSNTFYNTHKEAKESADFIYPENKIIERNLKEK